MIGFGRTTVSRNVPERSLAPTDSAVASLTFTGKLSAGATNNETRTLKSLTITNNGTKPIYIGIESEATKESFSDVVQPDETKVFSVLPLEMYWNTNRRLVGWDGLNISWGGPA